MIGKSGGRRCAVLLLLALAADSRLTAQGGELARLISLYHSGKVEPAVAGLVALSRLAETPEQRALVEHHLGLALIRTRPAESSAALRRSIALNPDLRPDGTATGAERAAWEAVRVQMSVPSAIRFQPAMAIPGSGDSIGVYVDLPIAMGQVRPRVRVLLALAQGRDTVELWSGSAGELGAWDGTFAGELPAAGSYPLVVEVSDEPGTAPLRWQRSLHVDIAPVVEPLALRPRPAVVSPVMPVRVLDSERKARTVRRALVWAVGGSVVSFAASRAVPDAINMSAPNGGARIAVASIYGTGLAAALYGSTKLAFSLGRTYETSVSVPDESILRRQRFAEAKWLADSVRVSALNARRAALRLVSVEVRESR